MELSVRTGRPAENTKLAVETQRNENKERDAMTNRNVQCDGNDSDVNRDDEDAGPSKACQDAQGVT